MKMRMVCSLLPSLNAQSLTLIIHIEHAPIVLIFYKIRCIHTMQRGKIGVFIPSLYLEIVVVEVSRTPDKQRDQNLSLHFDPSFNPQDQTVVIARVIIQYNENYKLILARLVTRFDKASIDLH